MTEMRPIKPVRRKKPMDDETFSSVAKAMVDDARDFVDSDVKEAMERGFRYLNGKVDATASPGRSKVVMTDVRDAVDQMMPQLMEVFSDTAKVVEFDPVDAEDAPFAEDATTYVNFVYARDNPAWRNTHDFIRDALEAKIGVFTARWSADDRVAHESYDGLSPEELVGLLDEPGVELLKGSVEALEEGDEDEVIDEANDLAEGETDTQDEAPAGAGGPVAGPLAPGMSAPPMPPMGPPSQMAMPGGAAGPHPGVPGGPPPGAPSIPGAPPAGGPPAEDAQEEADRRKTAALYNVTIKRKRTIRKVTVETVPPEELIIDRFASTASDAMLVGRDCEMTISDIVSLGFDRAEVEDAAAGGGDDRTSDAKEQRSGYSRSSQNRNVTKDDSSKPVRVVRCWARIDADRDGVAEWHSLVMIGSNLTIIQDDVVPYPCIVVCSPYRKPHEAIGRSLADRLTDMQDIDTALMRGVLDNLYSVNRPRREVVEGQVNWEDLMSEEHEGNVRVRQPGMIRELTVPFVAGQTLPVFDFLEKRREQRTGISAASAGLDPDSLQSSTAVGVAATISASQQMIKMVARTMAEDGFGPLFKLILKIIVDHQAGPRTVQLSRGVAKTYDPQGWNSDMDVVTRVGLGRGEDDEMVKMLTGVAAKQEMILQTMGPSNPVCDLSNYARTLHDMCKYAGVKNSGRYFNSPEDVAEKLKNQPPPPPSPEEQKAQAKIQLEQAKGQQQIQLAQAKAAAAAQVEQQKLQAKITADQAETQGDIATNQARAAADMQVEHHKAQHSMHLERVDTAHNMALSRMKAGHEIALNAQAALDQGEEMPDGTA